MAGVDRCAVCGAPVPEGRQVCPACGNYGHQNVIVTDGGTYMEKRRCRNCLNTISKNDNFCSRCGMKLKKNIYSTE